MDKLENESWEEYAFRKDLFTIIWETGCINKIKEVNITPECHFIMNELYKIRDKYKMRRVDSHFPKTITQEDLIYYKWLYARKYFLETERQKKYEVDKNKKENRYKELVSIISETHKEHLNELLEVMPFFDAYLRNEERKDENHKKRMDRNLELYNKYMKNKELIVQINELEIKLNELKLH